MLVYIYDGSFEGLLTVIHEVYHCKRIPDRIESYDNMQIGLLDEQINVTTDNIKSDKVYTSIIEKISEEALENAYHVFLSNETEKDLLIYLYLRLGWKLGNKLNLDLSNDTVLRVEKISTRVAFEVHRLMGFVRFKVVDGEQRVYYSVIEPDNNILELLAPHFAERYSDQNWVIHDKKRKKAAVYNRDTWTILSNVPEIYLMFSDEEKHYSELWRKFFKTIAIDIRKNPKLQKNLMPVRYWKHLVEFE